MIVPRWAPFNIKQRYNLSAATEFLRGRIDRVETIVWALKLKSSDEVLRAAVLSVVDEAVDRGLAEPWNSAWRMIEEAWDGPPSLHNTGAPSVHVHNRVRRGDRSGVVIAAIVSLVKPRLHVMPGYRLDQRSKRWRPKHIRDLVHTSLSSGECHTPGRLGLDQVTELEFLVELARALDAAVHHGLETARRFGWDGKSTYGVGGLDRVETILADGTERHQVDDSHTGIAPSTKLLHWVVAHLAELSPQSASSIVASFRTADTLVHKRLWASFAREDRFAKAEEVEVFLLDLNDEEFWFLHSYPEVAELRARRFGELSAQGRTAILARLRPGPPRNLWRRRNTEGDRPAEIRRYWTARELRRIQIAGSILPETDANWLATQLAEFGDLAASDRIDEGFPGAYEAYQVLDPGDDGYDLITGRARLQRLERALRTPPVNWSDDPSDRAATWIAQPRNTLLIIADLEAMPAGARDFAAVWERIGWRHNPHEVPGVTRDLADEARRVLDLLEGLHDDTLEQAVDGLTDWLSDWSYYLREVPALVSVWSRVWPHALARTNSEQPEDEPPSLNVIIQGSDDRQPQDLDTYNTAVGKMVGVFLNILPNLDELGGAVAFPPNSSQSRMRETLMATDGRAGLVVRHRLSEHLSYFMKADADWAEDFLLSELSSEEETSLPLWNAVVRRVISQKVLEIIAPFVRRRAIDPRLPRETRKSLAIRLVVDSLYAFRDKRAPYVTHADLQQMIIDLDDEIRAAAAEALQRFLQEVTAVDPFTREELFSGSVEPFLRTVWPQERSLTTPGVSKALADLPAAAGEMFPAAVDAIERFLVPFECWSMIEYGLYGDDENQRPRMSRINTGEKAASFLQLLDRTIPISGTASIPNDLSSALQQIRTVAPRLAGTPSYRRLATAARL